MLLRGHEAEHRRAVPAGHGRTDSAGDVVVAGGDVGDEAAFQTCNFIAPVAPMA